jgi:hypothetical protein
MEAKVSYIDTLSQLRRTINYTIVDDKIIFTKVIYSLVYTIRRDIPKDSLDLLKMINNTTKLENVFWLS